MIYVDPDDRQTGYVDAFSRIEKCRAHYAASRLGADFVGQFTRWPWERLRGAIAMDVRLLRTLVMVADRGSFAAAAEALGLSQSSVSQHIRQIEERFRIELFDRSRRPPELSAAGRVFVERARDVVVGYRDLEDGFARAKREPRVTLRIGVIPTLVGGVLAQALARLRDARPDLRIALQAGLSHDLEPLVGRGRIECAITAEPEKVKPGLRWTAVGREPLIAIGPAEVKGDTDADLLTARPFIRFKRFAWAARLIDAELERRSIEIDSAMEVDSLEGIAGLVAQGLGVSVIPHGAASRALPEGLRSLPFGDPPVSRMLGLLEGSNRVRSPIAEALLQELSLVLRGQHL